MLQKIIDCKCLDIFQKKICDGVSFSKVTSLQCSDCNFTIKRTHHRFFLDYVLKTSCIKKTILRKKSVVDKRHNKVAALLCTALSFIKKNGAHVLPSCRSVESSSVFTGKPNCQRLLSLKLQIQSFFPAISLKRLHHRGFLACGLHGSSFIYFQDIFCEMSLQNILQQRCMPPLYRLRFY